ncbi:MAG: HAD hydrolase family protein [Arachnia sp.]
MTYLLVSDLDGTLLTSRKELSQRSVQVLDEFIAVGGMFSIATARMAYGCEHLLGFDLRLPGVVMNGAALYSFAERRYLQTQPIADAGVIAASNAVAEAGAGAFVYGVDRGQIRLGCTAREDLAWEQYNSVRARAAAGPATILGPRNWERLGEIVYLAVVGSQAQLLAVADLAAGIPELAGHPYHNVYTGNDCLEFSSNAAGKQQAVRGLQQRVGADRLIVFGDNRNDLGMMNLADRSFAPEGSAPRGTAGGRRDHRQQRRRWRRAHHPTLLTHVAGLNRPAQHRAPETNLDPAIDAYQRLDV